MKIRVIFFVLFLSIVSGGITDIITGKANSKKEKRVKD